MRVNRSCTARDEQARNARHNSGGDAMLMVSSPVMMRTPTAGLRVVGCGGKSSKRARTPGVWCFGGAARGCEDGTVHAGLSRGPVDRLFSVLLPGQPTPHRAFSSLLHGFLSVLLPSLCMKHQVSQFPLYLTSIINALVWSFIARIYGCTICSARPHFTPYLSPASISRKTPR